MGLHHGIESSQEKKAKQNKKQKKEKRKKRKKPIKAENSRVLLKTIPNENEMKNKYKTKLKTVHYLTPTVFCWQYLRMKTFSWLPLIPTPSPEVTRGWSKLAFRMQTLGFVVWTCLAEGSLLVCAEQESQALFYPCPSSASTQHWSTNEKSQKVPRPQKLK